MVICVLKYLANKPIMNSNQQTHQAMQGKYSNYQVSASQNNQLVSFLNLSCILNDWFPTIMLFIAANAAT